MSSAAQRFSKIGEYEIHRHIGSGYFTDVFLASKGNSEYALKVLKKEHRTKAEKFFSQFNREACTIARIQSEYVLRVCEMGSVDGLPFLVTSYVPGETLKQRINKKPLSPLQVIKTSIQIASGLDHLSKYGLVHRDLKPDNIMINERDEIIILDFGFAAGEQSQEGSNQVIGTFLYCPPEQSGMLKRPVDARSDYYALGVTMYECLTGRLPFITEEFAELLKMHMTTPPPSLVAIDNGISPILESIVFKLMAKDPDERYQTAKGLIYDLKQAEKLIETGLSSNPFKLGSHDELANVWTKMPIIGREKEVDHLNRAWSECLNSRGTVIQVEGEPGIGKSRLVSEITERVYQSRGWILRAKGQKTESSPFGVIRESLNSLADSLSKLSDEDRTEQIKKIKSSAGSELEAVVGLSRTLKKFLLNTDERVEKTSTLSEGQDRRQFIETIATFFLALSKTRPLLLIIDDIQWTDTGSREILTTISDRITAHKLLLLTTARNDPDSEQIRQEFVDSAGKNLSQIKLSPLTISDVHAMCSYQLGGSKIEDDVASKLTTASNGNPFAVGEYIKAMLDNGFIIPYFGTWQVDLKKLNELTLSTDVIQLVLARLDKLSEEAFAHLAAAAIVGTFFNADLIKTVTGAKSENLYRILDDAIRANLIEHRSGDEYCFVHDRILEAVLTGLDSKSKQELHYKIAKAMDKSQQDLGGTVYELARHYLSGYPEKDKERVVEVLCAAGEASTQESAYKDVEFYLKKALSFELNLSADVKRAVFYNLGNALMLQGKYEESLSYLYTAATLAHSRKEAVKVSAAISRCHMAEGNMHEAWIENQRALRILGAEFPKNQIIGFVSFLWNWLTFEVLSRSGVGYGLAKTGWAREKAELFAGVYESASIATFFIDPTAAMQVSMRNAVVAHLLGKNPEGGKGLTAMALILSALLGKSSAAKRAKRLSEEIIQYCQETGNQPTEQYMRGNLLICDMITGEFNAVDKYWAEHKKATLKYADGYTRNKGYCFPMEEIFLVSDIKTAKSITAEDEKIISTGSKFWIPVVYSRLYFAHVLMGDMQSATRYKAMSDAALSELSEYPFFTNVKTVYLLASMELNEFSSELDEYENAFLNTAVRTYSDEPVMCRTPYVAIGYYKLAKIRRAKDEASRKAALKGFRRHISLFRLRAGHFTPFHRSHVFIFKAALATELGRYQDALHYLDEAQWLTDLCEKNPWAQYMIYLEHARLLKKQGKPTAKLYATAAMELATTSKWVTRVDAVQKEFKLSNLVSSPNYAQSVHASVMASDNIHQNRIMDILLQVGVASTTSTDPIKQGNAVLDEIIKLLGAERAFVFMFKEESSKLELTSGRNSEGKDLKELTGYSSTVVTKVFQTLEPMIVTGTEEGEAIGSQSAIIHGLRSIIAVPLDIRDKVLGVLYLDSTLAKGLFTKKDVGVLSAIAKHISVSFEMSRAAQIELDKAQLEKDLAVQKAVSEMSRKVSTLVDNIQQSLFSIDHDGTIVEPISKYSKSVFGTDVSGKNVLDVVYKDLPKDSESFAALKTGLVTVMGEDDLQWDLMSDSFPNKVTYVHPTLENSKDRTLRVRTQPLLNEDGLVEQIIYVVEDETELEKLKREVEAQTESTQLLQQLAKVNRIELKDFFNDAERLLDECYAHAKNPKEGESDIILARNLHTLKGNSRLYNLNLLSSSVHKVESDVIEIWSKELDRDQLSKALLDQLSIAQTILGRYRQIASDVIGLNLDKSGQSAIVEIPSANFKNLMDKLEKFRGKIPDFQFEELRLSIESLPNPSFKNSLLKYENMVAELSARMNKKVNFIVDGDEIMIDKERQRLIQDGLVHLLRNALDHGIEEPSVRKEKGKPETGEIKIVVAKRDIGFEIIMSDDGAGIDAEKVASSALKKGFVKKDDLQSMSTQQKLDLILLPGFSTRDTASETSGRGVGMDVVSSNISEIGGKLTISTNLGKGTTFKISLTKNATSMAK